MAAITSALIGAAGAIGGGLLAASGAKKAAKAHAARAQTTLNPQAAWPFPTASKP